MILVYFGDHIYSLQIKKASAECEDAWKGAGTKVGVQVWRIVKFKVGLDSILYSCRYNTLESECTHIVYK